MGYLYVNENGATIGIDANQFYVKYKDGMKKMIPAESLESITILGKVQLTTQCIEECLKRGIPVAYFSKGGTYFGRLSSTGHVNAQRQRKQSELYDTDFALELARKIIMAKLKNQSVVAKRYALGKVEDVDELLKEIKICQQMCRDAASIHQLMGYEGYGAKKYFEILSHAIDSEFRFNGRSKRPPKDEFNSMISFGYSILMNEVYSKIELKGLNPYFGFMHRDAENHPTLASDLMEEWRAVLIDSTVMSLINGHEITKADFERKPEDQGYYITRTGLSIYLKKLEKKLQTDMKYLDYVDYAVSFRRAIALQINSLTKAIDAVDPSLYHPITIR